MDYFTFKDKIKIIGVNPYVVLPDKILQKIFETAGRDKGPIPVRLMIDNKEFIQHLVRFQGLWRLYLNTPMRSHAGKDVGDLISIGIAYDAVKREQPENEAFQAALSKSKKATAAFEKCPPSRQKEIVRYINSLKSEESRRRNIEKAILFLEGKGRFVGRDHPL